MITVGGISFGIGASMWVTSLSIITTITNTMKVEEAPNLFSQLNIFSQLGTLFSVVGMAGILIGFLVPIFLLWPKSKKNESESNTCYCGNTFPCSIHENKSGLN